LTWWQKKAPLPPTLILSGSATDPVPAVLGQPGTKLTYAFGEIGYGPFLGAQAELGGWLDERQVLGLDASSFVLEQRRSIFSLNNLTGTGVLGFRHLDPSGAEDVFAVEAPAVRGGKVGPFAGGLAMESESRLWGAEAKVLHGLYATAEFRLRLLAGVRYLDLSESLVYLSRKAPFNGGTAPFLGTKFGSPAVTLTDDQFHTRDQFVGAQAGLHGDWVRGPVYLGFNGTVALGRTNEVLQVAGFSTLQAKNVPPVTTSGGLFALPTNGGRNLGQDFGVVPQFEVRGGVQATSWLRAFAGYDFLYWTRILRPGDQVDVTVDPRQVPTDPAFKSGAAVSYPRPLLHHSDFWVQGVIFGLELAY
jgi:hypothetical protein